MEPKKQGTEIRIRISDFAYVFSLLPGPHVLPLSSELGFGNVHLPFPSVTIKMCSPRSPVTGDSHGSD